MSGYELKRKPGMTSIHAAYANKSRKSTIEEETELITPALISDLENKIKKLIRNVELYPANNVENTLKKAREIEEKIAEIIKTMFGQIKKEAAGAVISNQAKENGSKAKGALAPRDVDILLVRLGEVEETLKKYADRVIKMKAFKVLSEMSAKDRKYQNTSKNLMKCSRVSRVSKNEEKKCSSKNISQPKEVKTNKTEKTEKTDKKKGKGK